MAERIRFQSLIDDLRADLRSGLRWLRRSPIAAGAAVISIAVGVGAATAVFSLIDAVLVTRLPVREPGSLVVVARVDNQNGLGWSFTYPAYVRLRDSGALAETVAAADLPIAVDDGASLEPASGLLVSGNYFEALGLAPHAGRLLTRADDRAPGAHPLVVLAHGFWTRRFAGDPAVVGRVIRLAGHAMTIVGVAPARFRGLEGGVGPDVYVPLAMQAEMMAAPPRFADAAEPWVGIVGRVPAGTTREAAAARAGAILRAPDGGVAAGVPADRRVLLVDGARGRPTWRQRLVTPLAALGGLASAILLLVWANVANLLLARTIGRQGELAVRMTLGAGRARLVAQLVVEGLLLAAAGGGLGLVLAGWASSALATLALPSGASPLVAEALAGSRSLGVALVLIAATGVVCALAPALATRSMRLATGLRLDTRTTIGRRLLGRKALVAAQVGLSIVLLVGAGLFARTLANLRAVDLGVETSRLVTVRLDPTLAGYDLPRVRQLHDELIDRVAAVPGVRSASVAMIPLLAGSGWGSGLTLDTGLQDDRPGPDRNAVGPGYFHTLGTTIVAGRAFSRNDATAAPKVAIVNEAFARRYFGGAALGRRIGVGGPAGRADTTIVGVVRDGKYAGVREAAAPFWYVPYAQVDLLGRFRHGVARPARRRHAARPRGRRSRRRHRRGPPSRRRVRPAHRRLRRADAAGAPGQSDGVRAAGRRRRRGGVGGVGAAVRHRPLRPARLRHLGTGPRNRPPAGARGVAPLGRRARRRPGRAADRPGARGRPARRRRGVARRADAPLRPPTGGSGRAGGRGGDGPGTGRRGDVAAGAPRRPRRPYDRAALAVR